MFFFWKREEGSERGKKEKAADADVLKKKKTTSSDASVENLHRRLQTLLLLLLLSFQQPHSRASASFSFVGALPCAVERGEVRRRGTQREHSSLSRESGLFSSKSINRPTAATSTMKFRSRHTTTTVAFSLTWFFPTVANRLDVAGSGENSTATTGWPCASC